ncbi:diguanylate cyclase [Herbaspirillum sp. NPDC087042]|uniref:sensor domain-containing diguanylate cyclase n=1 Tax=Herbaspirillum sp. NPDC087042 TaxID=3364004 RepID=UPI0038288179
MRPILAKAGQVARHSLARRARLFVILICAAIASGHIWQSWEARQAHLESARIYSGNIAKALARHAYDVFQATDGLLLDVGDRINTVGIHSTQLTQLLPVLRRLSAEMPQLDGLYVYDAEGNRVVSSSPPRIAGANNSDRDYFIYHRDHTDPRPLIGKALISRSTGHWIIPMSRRLNHPDGSFAGVLLATLEVEHFNELYRTVDIGHGGSIALMLRQGTLLTRLPFDSTFVNRDFSDGKVFKDLLPVSPSGYLETVSRLDGVERYLSYQAVEKYPLVLVVTLARDEAMAEWRQQTVVYGVAVLLLLMIIGLFGWRMIGQIDLRLAAEVKLLQAMRELQQANHRLEMLVHQDGLTGLANRRHLDTVLESEYRRAMRSGRALSVVMIDVDFFKQYNDLYGHQAGDECLRRVSGVLRDRQRRPGDLAARYGGEEMLMLLPDTDAAGAFAVAEKIRAGIQALDIAHRGNPVGVVTVSGGVCALELLAPQDISVEQLLGSADAALYEAKHGGRNQVRLAAPGKTAPAGAVQTGTEQEKG